MSEHTPGPWSVHRWRAGKLRFISVNEDAQDTPIARLYERLDINANARLIAAAPDLLAACEEALTLWSVGEPEPDELFIHDKLQAAITKARGHE